MKLQRNKSHRQREANRALVRPKLTIGELTLLIAATLYGALNRNRLLPGVAYDVRQASGTPSLAEIKKFQVERSHADARVVNEHARTAIQSMILINGGALTAILAFSSKYSDPTVFFGTWAARFMMFGVIAYVVGVVLAAYNFRLIAVTSYYWMIHWEESFLGTTSYIKGGKTPKMMAQAYRKRGEHLFSASLTSFVIGTFAVGLGILPLTNAMGHSASLHPVIAADRSSPVGAGR